MMRILITGRNSYIGSSVKAWLLKHEQHYIVDEICVKTHVWRRADFSIYDAVFHVAGLAHSDTGEVTKDMKDTYFLVNTDLAIEVAKKAKLEGVRQFIFMSSMIVYGSSAPFEIPKRITKEIIPKPTNTYGNSKWQAELRLADLKSDSFKIVILRPPMVYGKGSKGNYPRLAEFAKKLPLFPRVENERSMIHIDNLCEFIRLMIENCENGLFFPQNKEYVKTSDLVREIAIVHGKKIHLTKFFTLFLRLFAKRSPLVNKVFGNLTYDLQMSEYKQDYRIRSFEESIKLTEK